MKNTKKSITYKIIAGYILAIILAFIAFWVIYNQITNYTQINKVSDENSKKLILVGEAITGLYEAESLTRNIIQTSDVDKYDLYKNKIDSILQTIDEIAYMSYDSLQIQKMDSIKILVDSKNQNFESLIAVYRQKKEKGLQENVIDQLKKSSVEYGNYRDYDKRFQNYSAGSKRVLKKLLEWSKEDNEQRLTSQTLDSVANRFYRALAEIEAKERKYEREIEAKENKLLKNDQIITRQLRDLMAGIESNERNEYYERIAKSRDILDRTSNFIVIITAISLVIAIIFLYLITTDVSKSQKYRNELEDEKNYTETLLNTRETLINTVTHDLRSPLNTVIGYSDLLEKTGLDTKQQYYLEHLKKSSDYILHLVNDLLDLSKLEAGRMVIEKLPFSPKKLIENTVLSVIPPQDKKQLDIRVHTDEALGKQFIGDPFRIKQVLTNLISNAYKFTDEGAIRIESKLLSKNKDKKELTISVEDTGIGIDAEQQKYIFEEFSQGDDTIEKKYGGFGLGLSITQKIIQLLDGTITLKSEPGKGSVFVVKIPIELASSQVMEEEIQSIEINRFKNQRALIIDDDPSQLKLTGEIISLAGLNYDTGMNGKEALKVLAENEYDIILSDIQMPKMDGFTLLKHIKSDPKTRGIPVIALSGRTNKHVSEYKEAGFSGSLRKPYSPADLLQLISQFLQVESKISVTPVSAVSGSDGSYSLEDLSIFAQGDPDSLYAIIDTFYQSTRENIEALKIAASHNNTTEISQLAHKMLPMFKQIKAVEISPILNQLEHQEDKNLEEILKLTKNVIRKIEKLISELKVNL